MGQAKARGTREIRINHARAEQLREEPINVQCKTCKAPLNGFTLLTHTKGGAAWQKRCDCGAITTAIVQPKGGRLDRTFRESLSLEEAIAGPKPGKRAGLLQPQRTTSVSFFEKTVDTVETGLIRL